MKPFRHFGSTAGFGALTAVMFQVEVVWVVTSCSVIRHVLEVEP
jgi:hypothetical protein